MSRGKRKKHEAMAKHRKTKRPKKRTPGPLRGVMKRQRRRQRKKVSFSRLKSLPAFFLFMAEHRAQLQKSNPHWTAAETAKKLGKMWHKQPKKDKEMYKEQAERLRRKKQKRKSK